MYPPPCVFEKFLSTFQGFFVNLSKILSSYRRLFKKVTFNSLIEVLVAFHYSSYVNSPIQDRGGLALVAPPGNLKSSCILSCYEHFSDTITLSDVDAKTLNALKPEFENGRYHTLALPDFEKLYQRNSNTSANAEGVIAALVAQGMAEASFIDHRILGVSRARCSVVLGMVPNVVQRRMPEWIDNGFARRFMWCNFHLSNSRMIVEAIHNWKRIELEDSVSLTIPMKNGIPSDSVTEHESRQLERLVCRQYDVSIPLLIMRRILCVLKWKHKENPRKPMQILKDFSESLGRERAKLTL